MRGFPRSPMLTPDEGPSLETSIFPLSFQVVREPLPFAYQMSQYHRIVTSLKIGRKNADIHALNKNAIINLV